MKRHFLLRRTTILFCTTALVLSGCQKETELPVEEISAVTVTTEVPERRTVSISSNFIGTVEADAQTVVVSMISGEVTSKYFEVGDHVETGDLLFTIDDASYQLALRQANASLSSAQAGLTAQQAANASVKDSATETMGKIASTEDQLALATDSARTQAEQAGISYDSALLGIANAQEAYDYANDQKKRAKDARDSARDARDAAESAVGNAQSAVSSAQSAVSSAQAALDALDDSATDDERAASQKAVDEASAELEARQKALSSAQSSYSQASSAYETAKSAYDSAKHGVEQAEIGIATAQNNAQSAGLQYDLARENAEVTAENQTDFELFTKPSITTGVGAQLVGGDAQVKVSESTVKQAQVGVDSAKLSLDYTQVESPVSGTITAINVSEHNMVSPQIQAYVIESDAQNKVVFYVAEKTAEQMTVGNDALLSKDGEEYAARITSVATTVDAITGLFKIEAMLNDASIVLTNGSSVSLKTVTRESQNVLTVPIDSVYYDGEQAYVYVNENGTAVRRDIVTGLSDDLCIEVAEGLAPTDQVVVSWSSQLKDGTQIIAN